MSISYIPEPIRLRLWAQAAGRCEYEGCNLRLWIDSLTKFEYNAAYIAHIVADKPDGPRGDPILSERLKADLPNLMLLCDSHHRLVDKIQVEDHPVERLTAMKRAHEQRIDIVTDIAAEKQSHILLYGANIGSQNAKVSYFGAARAMIPVRYPAEATALSLGLKNSSFDDAGDEFWRVESQQLRALFEQSVRPRLRAGDISHLSVFALAPQPLLILLGSLLSDIPAADVYQLHREPAGWRWENQPDDFDYLIQEPAKPSGIPALVFALSATVTDARIQAVLGGDVAIWRVTIPTPHNDFLKSRKQSEAFRKRLRQVMDRIKAHHGEDAIIRVFPAMPVALAVEFGRILMPKADLPLDVYDENRKLGGFVRAIEINKCVMQ
ncbi:MAG TPA: SAVED domain-containing protein [Candidatus Sulfotelmatobacter sp.]|nr:SAVED domain-containing protein [Candidatus Sulfotelmatobacter sp.]